MRLASYIKSHTNLNVVIAARNGRRARYFAITFRAVHGQDPINI